jgi:hypothetical protein
MTNTERRSAVELDELPPWDDAETLDRLAAQLTVADTRTLAIYGLDSDHQTLVGIGPIERARRSRASAEKPEATEKPDSQRMPPSEPPGPFIAAEDDELPPFARSRKLSAWALAVPAALLVAAAALIFVRGQAPDSVSAGKLSRAIVAQRLSAAAAIKPAPVETQPGAASEPAVPTEPAEHAEEQSEARLPEVPAVRPQAAQTPANAPAGISALPVKLPEVSSPVVVDRASGTDVNVGTINVTSNPPANVVLDGRPVGKAPRVVRVPAGTHSLVFIHPLYGRRSLSVSVRPGATAGASAEF